jgi:uncharacterized circularly permuted ATP-grasp superfamily protein/uncharacterized alpha-E superfamily protein
MSASGDGTADAPLRAASERCLATYVPDPRRYDELLDAGRTLRPHWRPLIEQLTAEDPRGVARRQVHHTRRLVVENGVTYNVYADPKGADRPWALEPLPVVLTGAEWRRLESGLAQRARLLDALLADLYGAQRLLAEGVVPAALVFGHPNFLWPCRGLQPQGGRWLHLYAADLARAPDGRWWVLADRTQAPSGAGYALENREIIEQVMPQAIHDLAVRRIDGFFGELRERLLEAPEGEVPLAVILTPGPFNETYFEHAYLARQLGVPLVESTDLTVRDDTVYLKTLAGLKRVHTILRRVDDDFCDPLELRSESALGLPGLLGALRRGRVVLANALGSGVLESAAWIGFLPRIAERLLGERLELPAVATWWCGEEPALEYVLTHLDALVVKPAYPNQRFEPVFGHDLDREARAELAARLRARPYAYVAQEYLPLSHAPVWRPPGALGFAAKAVSLRAYTLATPLGRRVLPGGLARVASGTAVDVVSTQRGGGAKDVWVLAEPGVSEPPVVPRASRHPTSRHDDLPSRLVENLYWFGRYTTRCEDKSRLLRALIGAAPAEPVRGFAQACGEEFGLLAGGADAAASLRDERNPLGLQGDVRRLAWCAGQIRTRLSAGCWRAVGDLQRRLQEAIAAREEPRKLLDELLLSLTAVAGFALDGMTRDSGWRLLRIGRRLERLQFAATLLALELESATALAPAQIEWLLESCDSVREYRARYLVAPRLGPLLDLLIRDAEHPRALAFQGIAIAEDLAMLARSLGAAGESGLGQSAPALRDRDLALLERATPPAVEARRGLARELRALAGAASALSDRLSLRHFAHINLDLRAVSS